MDIALFHSLWTLVLLVLFIGIVVWAWSRERKPDFDAAARLPLEDDKNDAGTAGRGGHNHG
jgi:cytochrome c oxidase cbb3-type subunit 4